MRCNNINYAVSVSTLLTLLMPISYLIDNVDTACVSAVSMRNT